MPKTVLSTLHTISHLILQTELRGKQKYCKQVSLDLKKIGKSPKHMACKTWGWNWSPGFFQKEHNCSARAPAQC